MSSAKDLCDFCKQQIKEVPSDSYKEKQPILFTASISIGCQWARREQKRDDQVRDCG
jgi:hypothetical protein